MTKDSITYRKPCPDGVPLYPVSYSFLHPAVLTIERPNGDIDVISYGIGDSVTVMEPTIQYLVCLHDKHEKIPLADGSFIIDWPSDLNVVSDRSCR